MNYYEHNPPYFHAEYQNDEVTVDIQTSAVTGKMPRRALNLIWTWLDEHQAELLQNWEKVRKRQELRQIEPLV